MYKHLGDAHDRIVGVRVGDEGWDLMRIRNVIEVGFDGAWREFTISPSLSLA